MKEDFSEFNNHTVIEVNLIHTESCDLLTNFVEGQFYIKKQDQTFKVIDEIEGVVVILSYKLGDYTDILVFRELFYLRFLAYSIHIINATKY